MLDRRMRRGLVRSLWCGVVCVVTASMGQPAWSETCYTPVTHTWRTPRFAATRPEMSAPVPAATIPATPRHRVNKPVLHRDYAPPRHAAAAARPGRGPKSLIEGWDKATRVDYLPYECAQERRNYSPLPTLVPFPPPLVSFAPPPAARAPVALPPIGPPVGPPFDASPTPFAPVAFAAGSPPCIVEHELPASVQSEAYKNQRRKHRREGAAICETKPHRRPPVAPPPPVVAPPEVPPTIQPPPATAAGDTPVPEPSCLVVFGLAACALRLLRSMKARGQNHQSIIRSG